MDIVMLHRQGLSKRQIAKRLGIHRGTVSGYLSGAGSHRHPPRQCRTEECTSPNRETCS
jgi:predicted transcriptional regulator